MNVKRFAARTSREALAMVRGALGDDAVVLSTRPGAEGVEVLAMAPEGLQQIEAAAARTPAQRSGSTAAPGSPRTLSAPPANVPTLRQEVPATRAASGASRAPLHPMASPGIPVAQDVETLGMSTLTFQDYVRERMLRRRQAELDEAAASRGELPAGAAPLPPVPARAAVAAPAVPPAPRGIDTAARAQPGVEGIELPVLRDEIHLADVERTRAASAAAQRDHREMLGELRSMKSLIEERFGMLAFMEKLQRDPRQAELAQKLLDTGLSPALIRKVVQGLPADITDEMAWATAVLERNVVADEVAESVEMQGGVYALIGATGVGKTTSTAKIAAAFAARHGASNLGLITLDAYRIAAHEQLRTYGRILGVPVHTAHDRASLEDLLELLSGKKMVLIDTAGMAQRDARTRELLEMLSHPSIRKLLVINAAAQGETVEDVMVAYGAASCRGVIVSKLDEAVKLGPALDALIRHKCTVVGVANGQRVPEDWHHLSAQALVQRALRGGGSSSWRLDAGEVNLLFAGRHAVTPAPMTL